MVLSIHRNMNRKHSKKAIGADNQQERLKFVEGWLVGFTDGEGCFSVSIIRNSTTKLGWQVFPEFVITQSAKSIKSLEQVREFFGIGKIFINQRYDNHNANLYRYCVRSLTDLNTKIIPFFDKHRLQTAKKQDFKIFKRIVSLMIQKKHLSKDGMQRIAKLIQTMNKQKPQDF